MTDGIKYDQGKPRLAEMFIDFNIPMEELCKVWEFGANKYSKSNWKQVDNAIDRYTNAMLRHLIAEERETYDSESTYLHAAHIAFNALARLYFISRQHSNGKPGQCIPYDSKLKNCNEILDDILNKVL